MVADVLCSGRGDAVSSWLLSAGSGRLPSAMHFVDKRADGTCRGMSVQVAAHAHTLHSQARVQSALCVVSITAGHNDVDAVLLHHCKAARSIEYAYYCKLLPVESRHPLVLLRCAYPAAYGMHASCRCTAAVSNLLTSVCYIS